MARPTLNWPALTLASLTLLAILGAGCRPGNAGDGGSLQPIVVIVSTATPTPQPTASPTPSPTPTPTATPGQVCGPNPDPAPLSLLQVETPKPQETVRPPIQVRGWGSNIGHNDAGVTVAVVDAQQTVLQVLNVPPQPRAYRVAPPGLTVTEFTRPFAADILLSGLKEPTPFCLWVFLETAPDGSPRSAVQVPLVISP